jgi:hypothetical protein
MERDAEVIGVLNELVGTSRGRSHAREVFRFAARGLVRVRSLRNDLHGSLLDSSPNEADRDGDATSIESQRLSLS